MPDKWCYVFMGLLLFVPQHVAKGSYGAETSSPDSFIVAVQSQPKASPLEAATPRSQPDRSPEIPKNQSQPPRSGNEAKSTDWIQVGISSALLLVISVQALIYHRQRQVMQRQFTAMQDSLVETRKIVLQNERAVEAAEKQAGASEIAAQTARESAATARDAFDIIERAYIGIKEMGAHNFAAGGGPPGVIITFINGGRTPAWHFTSCVDLIVGQGPPSRWTWKPEKAVRSIGSSFIQSHGDKRVIHPQLGFRLTEAQQVAVRDKALKLFAVGEAHYTDIRGRGQVFEFCGVYDWLTGLFDQYYAEEPQSNKEEGT